MHLLNHSSEAMTPDLSGVKSSKSRNNVRSNLFWVITPTNLPKLDRICSFWHHHGGIFND